MIQVSVQSTTLDELTSVFILLGRAFADQAKMGDLTRQLKEGTDPLKAAVDANQP